MSSADLSLVVLTAGLGFCMARVSLCAVAAVGAWIRTHRYTGLRALLLAASAAGLVLLASAFIWPDSTLLPVAGASLSIALLGGSLLGIGALLNGGCYLGSVTYLGTGNSNYLFTLLGFAIAARWLNPIPTMLGADYVNSRHGFPLLYGLVVFAIALWLTLRVPTSTPLQQSRVLRASWPWPLAAVAAGVFAGLIYSRHAAWSYTRPIDAFARGHFTPVEAMELWATLALFAGVIVSALWAGNLHWTRPSPLKSMRCLLGGIVMGYGAAMVPGGNDTLLLWAIPGLEIRGFIAYGAMLSVIALLFTASATLQRRSQRC
jgi:toxin CptA